MKQGVIAACLLILLSLGARAAGSTVSLAPSAGEAAAYGINIPFTASAHTGRYRFEIYDGGSASGAPLASYGEARLIPGARVNLYLPFSYDPVAPHTYTLRVQALPEPGREGLDRPGEQAKPFTTGTVPTCGSGAQHAVSAGGFLAGDGTAASPFIVATPEQLDHVRLHLSEHFLQVRDIDLQGQGFTPIGVFSGVYDGGGYVVRNLTVNTAQEFAALFGQLSGAEIQNLGIENYAIYSSYLYGRGAPLAGSSASGELSTISRCYADTGTVTANDDAGGLVAYTNMAITDCYAVGGTLRSTRNGGHRTGGIATSSNYGSSMIRCFAVPSSMSYHAPNQSDGTGGLMGMTASSFESCYWMTGRGANYAVGQSSANPAGTTALSSLSSFNSFDTMQGFDPAVWRVGEEHLVLRVFDH